MNYYAQINENNIVIGISQLSEETKNDELIKIESYDEDYLWRKYENGVWSIEKYAPPLIQPPDELDNLNDYIVDMDYRLLVLELGL